MYSMHSTGISELWECIVIYRFKHGEPRAFLIFNHLYWPNVTVAVLMVDKRLSSAFSYPSFMSGDPRSYLPSASICTIDPLSIRSC